jgi:phosphatidylinositol glycan class B
VLILLFGMVGLDYIYYGKFVFVPWNFIYFNILKDIGSFYGTHPWHWYLTQGLPAIVASFIPFSAIGIYFSSDNQQKFYAVLIVIQTFVMSLLKHKEFRFECYYLIHFLKDSYSLFCP